MHRSKRRTFTARGTVDNALVSAVVQRDSRPSACCGNACRGVRYSPPTDESRRTGAPRHNAGDNLNSSADAVAAISGYKVLAHDIPQQENMRCPLLDAVRGNIAMNGTLVEASGARAQLDTEPVRASCREVPVGGRWGMHRVRYLRALAHTDNQVLP